jgi:RNA polymerase sigma-70 factor, ECF subfamily
MSHPLVVPLSEYKLPSDQFVGFLTSSQNQLLGYALACIGNYNDASDVLQKINMVLLKKGRDFENETDFRAWAFGVAKYEILAYVRSRQREKLTFSPELVESMAASCLVPVSQMSNRHKAMLHCISQLSESRRRLVQMRYSQDLTVQEIAKETGKTLEAIKAALVRLRRSLRQCIDRRLGLESIRY